MMLPCRPVYLANVSPAAADPTPWLDVLHEHVTAVLWSCNKSHGDTPGVPDDLFSY